MPLVNTVYSTVTCEVCEKTVTYMAQEEREILSKPENAWVVKTARFVMNLIPGQGQEKPKQHLFCSDECTIKASGTGVLNVPEPKRIVAPAASADAVKLAAQAAENARKATEAMKAGGPVTLG